MEESSSTSKVSLIQKQVMLQQQQQMQLQQEHQQISSLFQQQQQQQAISRFPSTIDAHLGIRHPHPPPHHQHHQQQHLNPNNNPNNNPNCNPNNNSSIPLLQQQQQQQKGGIIRAQQGGAEVQMAYQDAWRVCHPDFNRPFSSLEDACERLLPYHVVADYEAEEDDRILDSDTTGQVISKSQQWDNNIAAKVSEFTATFEKQVLAFNIISRKRALGEFRSEERLMIEQALLQEEKQAVYELKTEIESREKAGRDAQLRMAAAMVQAEQARGGPRGPLRGSAVGSQGSDEREHGPDEIMNNGWGSNNVVRDEREPSEDFLNDEETDNGETSGQHEWREVNEFDLNTR